MASHWSSNYRTTSSIWYRRYPASDKNLFLKNFRHETLKKFASLFRNENVKFASLSAFHHLLSFPFTTQLIFKNVSQRFIYHFNRVLWNRTFVVLILGQDLEKTWFNKFRKLIPTLALAGLAQAAWPLTGQCDGKEPVQSGIIGHVESEEFVLNQGKGR